jgi:hypothetical protein
VKTVNLTKWSTLYSSASKYNIHVKKSCFNTLTSKLSAALLCLFLIASILYNSYLLALGVGFIAIVITDLYLNQKSKALIQSFTISLTGEINFCNDNVSYQLIPNSRSSFLGCWLEMTKVNGIVSESKITSCESSLQIFIYKGQISHQDFSTLAKILSQL